MASRKKFGTFGGVFTPSILTILGVIMYLRLPMIVGEAGLIATIGIIVVAHVISLSTGLSVSSIATDKKVKAGGTYYMISRSLGLPIGGTLGLALFVGLSFSVSLYLIGFSESFLSYWGFEVTKQNIQITGSAILLFVTTITFISTSLAIKTQYFIMAAILLSLVSILIGHHDYVPDAPMLSNPKSTVPLMVLFGIFFPAVTGFEAGVSMSGDLKDPKKSIPTGAISAIIVGLITYIGLAFFFSYTVQGDILAHDSDVLLKISWLPQLVVAGIWGATLSSALGSILGAPRILQATAVDRISHRFFAKGVGKSNEPRNALLLTFVIAEAGILIGELDVIARIVSIFFITTYGFLNLSCAFERWSSADFRPEFKAPIWVSLTGAVACMVVMIQLDLAATLGATVILGAVFFLIKRKELSLQSGDTWSGVWASLVKSGLEYLNSKAIHTRNWRPNIMLFQGNPESRPYLIQIGRDLCGKLGLLTAFELIQSDQQTGVKKDEQEEEQDREAGTNFFYQKYPVQDVYQGIDEISRVYGFSGIRPNTVLMGWTRDEKRQDEFGSLISSFNKNHLNSMFLHFNQQREFGDYQNIDLWWSGTGSNLSFAISIIRYLTSGKLWKEVKIRLFVPVNNALLIERAYTTLERIIDQYRIAVEIKVINNAVEKLSPVQLIERESSNADLVIVGMPNQRYENMKDFMIEINNLLPLLGSSLLINASDQFEAYDLELSEETTAVTAEEQVSMPVIPQFMFPKITEEINRADRKMNELGSNFYDKTFLPHFLESNDWVQHLKEALDNTVQNFLKANDIQDQFRRNKAFFRIKNEFYFKITSLFEKKQTYKFNELKHTTEKGLQWYLDQLELSVSGITNSYRIEHKKIQFKITKGDTSSVRWIKLRKRILYLFAKNTIPVFVRYKNLSQHYLRDRQIVELHQMMADFEIWSYKFINELKTQINAIDDFIDTLGHQFVGERLTKLQIEKPRTSLLNRIQQVEIDVKSKQASLLQNLKMSYRKDLIAMGYDMEEINVNRLIGKNNLSKIAVKAKKEVMVFPEQWSEKAVLYYNKLDADVILTSFKSRVLKLVDNFKTDIQVGFFQKLKRDIGQLEEKLDGYLSDEGNNQSLKAEYSVDASLQIFKDIVTLNSDIMKLVDQLPRELALPREDDANKGSLEPVAVPVSKIARHLFESRFEGQIVNKLDNAEEAVVRLEHEINDQINLARFSLDNLERETELITGSKEDIIEGVRALLREKRKEIKEIHEQINVQFENALEEALEPLVSYKIIDSAMAFTAQIRGYKSKKLWNVMGNKVADIQASVMKQVAGLWYSKSEGVLLAKRLMESEKTKSRNEKVLDIVESVSPSDIVMNALPHYYKILFSGRSNITEEFWISMSREEEAFRKAIRRYRTSARGGIIVIGERNSGKTTLCQYVLKKNNKGKQVFHIYPPADGSVVLEDYVRELGKATGISASKDEIFKTLPYESIIVLHDLELWWEASPAGLEIIKCMLQDVDHYSASLLFVLNMNIHTYELINAVLDIQSHLISVIPCQPFDSESIKELISKRHKSSGLHFLLDKKQEEHLSQIKQAKLYNRYFDFTKGNPGVALNAWMSNIMQFKNEQLSIRYPEMVDTEVLLGFDTHAYLVLAQIALHKRMGKQKIGRVFELDEADVELMLRPLRLNGLVVEKSEGIFTLNPYIEPQVIRILKQKELL